MWGDATLGTALDAMVSSGVHWVPVIEHGRVAGIIGMSEVIETYQGGLRRSLRLLTGAMGKTSLVETTVGEGSRFNGATVADAPWPSGAVALSIDRQSQLLAPRADTVLCAGDVAVVPSDSEERLRLDLEGAGAPDAG